MIYIGSEKDFNDWFILLLRVILWVYNCEGFVLLRVIWVILFCGDVFFCELFVLESEM